MVFCPLPPQRELAAPMRQGVPSEEATIGGVAREQGAFVLEICDVSVSVFGRFGSKKEARRRDIYLSTSPPRGGRRGDLCCLGAARPKPSAKGLRPSALPVLSSRRGAKKEPAGREGQTSVNVARNMNAMFYDLLSSPPATWRANVPVSRGFLDERPREPGQYPVNGSRGRSPSRKKMRRRGGATPCSW